METAHPRARTAPELSYREGEAASLKPRPPEEKPKGGSDEGVTPPEPLTLRCVRGLTVCLLVSLSSASLVALFVSFAAWLFGSEPFARRISAPLREAAIMPIGWPTATIVMVVLTLLLFLWPIHLFLVGMYKGPWGTRSRRPDATTKRKR